MKFEGQIINLGQKDGVFYSIICDVEIKEVKNGQCVRSVELKKLQISEGEKTEELDINNIEEYEEEYGEEYDCITEATTTSNSKNFKIQYKDKEHNNQELIVTLTDVALAEIDHLKIISDHSNLRFEFDKLNLQALDDQALLVIEDGVPICENWLNFLYIKNTTCYYQDDLIRLLIEEDQKVIQFSDKQQNLIELQLAEAMQDLSEEPQNPNKEKDTGNFEVVGTDSWLNGNSDAELDSNGKLISGHIPPTAAEITQKYGDQPPETNNSNVTGGPTLPNAEDLPKTP